MRQRWTDYRVFWRQFRQAYHSTGAVLPSGRGLAAALAHYVRGGDLTTSNGDLAGRRILEVGPGTGAVTMKILSDMRGNDRLTLVERNEHFVAHLDQRLKEARSSDWLREHVSLVHSSVEDLPDDKKYDLIISGLPLNNFTVKLVDGILSKLGRLLAPGGIFSFFEYVAIRRAKSLMSSRAERERLHGIARVLGDFLGTREIRRDLVLVNVPPAWVHHVRIGAGGWGREAGSEKEK